MAGFGQILTIGTTTIIIRSVLLMNVFAVSSRFKLSPMLLFKCFVYGSLCFNGYQYILDDMSAAKHLLSDASSFSDVINIYSVTIDTIAWISLLIVFELETSILDDEQLASGARWGLTGVSVLCYIAILYACYGFYGKLFIYLDTIAYTLGDVCALVDKGYVYTFQLDEYSEITMDNCASFSPIALGQIAGHPILFEQANYFVLMGLSVVQTLNGTAWILIVALLAFEIRLQLKGELETHVMRRMWLAKFVLYGLLFAAAVYWGFYGNFIDFWDAMLWLLGFFIIELNLFEWNETTSNTVAKGEH